MHIHVNKIISLVKYLTAALTAIAVAIHVPGQISVDTSMQLFEAATGKSVSWNPPFMSALMNWLGDGEIATTSLVVLSSFFTYMSLGAVITRGLHRREIKSISIWRVTLLILILINPVILIYVGIVWKDVLFSAAITSCVAMIVFVAMNEHLKSAFITAGLTAILLSFALQIRQQGIFIAPILLATLILALLAGRSLSKKMYAIVTLLIISLFSFSLLMSKAVVDRTIEGVSAVGSPNSLRNTMRYDLAGIVSLSTTPTSKLAINISEDQRIAVRSHYDAERIDYLGNSLIAMNWLQATTSDQTISLVWLNLVKKEPLAFLRHKTNVYMRLLDFKGTLGCLPIHVGISGNPTYLSRVGFSEGINARAQWLFYLSQPLIKLPIYRHWCYLIVLMVTIMLIQRARLDTRLKIVCNGISITTTLYYLSFFPTGLACDFRYLYPAIPLITVLMSIFLTSEPIPSRNRTIEP